MTRLWTITDIILCGICALAMTINLWVGVGMALSFGWAIGGVLNHAFSNPRVWAKVGEKLE
jgi:uncharacterized membrane protein YbjE (DUF340 family)